MFIFAFKSPIVCVFAEVSLSVTVSEGTTPLPSKNVGSEALGSPTPGTVHKGGEGDFHFLYIAKIRHKIIFLYTT